MVYTGGGTIRQYCHAVIALVRSMGHDVYLTISFELHQFSQGSSSTLSGSIYLRITLSCDAEINNANSAPHTASVAYSRGSLAVLSRAVV